MGNRVRYLTAAAIIAATTLAPLSMAHAGPWVPPTPPEGAFQLEHHVGSNGPFGTYGLALAYDRGGRFAGGVGLGFHPLKVHDLPPMGLFGRVRALQWGWGSLGASVALSRQVFRHEGFVDGYWSSWSWTPAYRVTGMVGVELAHRRWSLRLDGGIGYLLSPGKCSARKGNDLPIGGSCDSAEMPAAVKSASQDERVLPSFVATVGYRFPELGWPEGAPDDAPAGYRSPLMALQLSLWPTLLPAIARAWGFANLLAGRSDDRDVLPGLAAVWLGLSFGPSLGLAYAGEHARAWAVGTLRLVGIGLGMLVMFSGFPLGDYGKEDLSAQAFGFFLIGASAVSAVYDVGDAPSAARRANARNGSPSLAVAPLAIPGPASPGAGVSMVGRF